MDKSVWMNGTDDLDRLAADIKGEAPACEHTVKVATSELIAHWARIGELLDQARACFPNNDHFVQWVVRAELGDVSNIHSRTAMRVIAAHRAEVEQQAASLDSVPGTAQMFLEKLNSNRQLFGLAPLDTQLEDERSGPAGARQTESVSAPDADVAEVPANSADSRDSVSALGSEPLSDSDARRHDLRSQTFQDLPEPTRAALASYPVGVRRGRSRNHSHGGKQFVSWLGCKIINGEIKTSVADGQNVSALTFVPELDHSFNVRNWAISRHDGKAFDRKMAGRLMREFHALKAAAQAGETVERYEYKRREQALAARSKKPIPEDAPIRQYQAAALEPVLPSEARLADGTPLRPRPIVVCGRRIWPGHGFEYEDYADVFLVTHYIAQSLLPLFSLEATYETVGSEISTMGTHFWQRHQGRWPKIAQVFSVVGAAIRAGNKKNPQPRHLWFMDMEPWHQKHAD
jgi:hypothetical protein